MIFTATFRPAPVVLIRRQHDAVASDIFGLLVGAGATGGAFAEIELLGGRVLALGRDDAEGRKIGRHQRRRRRGFHANGEIVDLAEFLAAHIGGGARRAFRHVRRALHSGDHIVRRERRAVMELDVLAELELPGRVVDRLPALGEQRGQRLLLVLPDQRLIDVPRQHVVGRDVVIMRIHRTELGRDADAQFLGRCPSSDSHDGRREKRGLQAFQPDPADLFHYALPMA